MCSDTWDICSQVLKYNWVFYISVCASVLVSVCKMCAHVCLSAFECSTYRGQKRASDTLELKSAGSHEMSNVGAGT